MDTTSQGAPNQSRNNSDVATALPVINVVAQQSAPARKRVRRACEYCRRKRLKCTADERPCLNCQLYGAECVPWPDSRKGTRRRARAATHVQDCPPQQPRDHHPGPTLSHDEQPACSHPARAHAHELSRPSPEIESDQDSLDAASPSAASLSGHVSDPLVDPGTTAVLDHAIFDSNMGFPQEFWDFDTLASSCNPPNELAVAEQLLALQSPPVTEPSRTLEPVVCPDAKGSVGKIFGMEKLLSQPTSSAAAISSGIFHRKEKGNSQFLGFTSTAAILARCVYESRVAGPRLSDSETLGFIVDSGPICDEIPCSGIPDVPRQQIPCSTLAVQYLNAFFEDTYPSHPIADQDEVRLILDRYVYHGHQSLGVLDRSILYLIMALGASSRSSSAATTSIDYENLYGLAWNLFPYAMAKPSLASVQVLLLHVLYNIHWSKWSIAWVLCGLVARVAQSVGLHLISPQDFGLEHSQLKLRTRLWVVTLILDAQLSMSQGRPPICQASQCDTELFSGRADLLQVSEMSWPLSEVLIWKLGLARIQQKINNAFSTSTSPEQRSNCLEEADIDLIKWKEQLPLEFRPDQQLILDGDAHIDIYMLHLDYHNLLQMIHWSSITHRPKGSQTDFAAPRMRASASICVGASLAMVRTLNAMTDANTRARSFRSRSDHFLSAMGIIYRDISCNPAKVSARTNLEYLRVIRIHLGRMSSKHLLSASLTNLIKSMVNSAELAVGQYAEQDF